MHAPSISTYIMCSIHNHFAYTLLEFFARNTRIQNVLRLTWLYKHTSGKIADFIDRHPSPTVYLHSPINATLLYKFPYHYIWYNYTLYPPFTQAVLSTKNMAASNASNVTRRQDFVVGMNEWCRMFLRAQLLLMCFSYSMETEFSFLSV